MGTQAHWFRQGYKATIYDDEGDTLRVVHGDTIAELKEELIRLGGKRMTVTKHGRYGTTTVVGTYLADQDLVIRVKNPEGAE